MAMNYEVASRPDLGQLIECVNGMRKRGWECAGGVSVCDGEYLQAMHKPMTEVTGLHDTESKFEVMR